MFYVMEFERGSSRYTECFSTRGRHMPVEFTYPSSGAQNVPIHSLVVIKLKEGNAHIISSSSLSYGSGVSSSLSTFSGISREHFIAGNYFPEEALKVNSAFPEKFPDLDIPGRVQEFEVQVKAAGSDTQKLAAIRTEGAWEPNQTIDVEIRAACFNPYHLEFKTRQE